jgi:synaptobrevin family protein YKT6
MKLYCITLLEKETGRHIVSAKDLTSFGYFQRSSVGEFMDFFSKTIADRTTTGARQSVQENDYMLHAHSRADGMVAIAITDIEYPRRVAHSLLTKVADEFNAKYPPTAWKGASSQLEFPELNDLLTKYQRPEEADPMMKIQKDLDETTIILHQTLESALKRGEKLDDLVNKADSLSASSKMFYKTAKKTNSCCVLQ